MKRIVTMLLALFVIVSALVFAIKYSDNKRNENLPLNDDENLGEVFKPDIADEGNKYLLIAEEEYLNLYQIGKNTALKKSERINTALFPEEDITNLTKGIEYTSSDDAFAAMENFVG